jgi:Ca2+-binding EF-hand superfamily protein
MKKLGFDYDKSEIEKMMKEVDIDNSGSIDFNEFLLIMLKK